MSIVRGFSYSPDRDFRFLERGEILVVDTCTMYVSRENELLPLAKPMNLLFHDLVHHVAVRRWASRLEPSVCPEAFKQDFIQVFSSLLFSNKKRCGYLDMYGTSTRIVK